MLKERYEDYTEQEFLVPASVAERLRGRSLASFDSLRRAFWKEVAKDEGLVNGLSPENIRSLEKGKPPRVRAQERAGKRISYELHHIQQISEDGPVYDVDNLEVLAPKAHIKRHSS